MTARHHSVKSRSGPAGLLRDLRNGFSHGPLWRSFAWDEIQNRYRRSVIGIAWISLSYLFFVVVIVIFFRGMNQADPQAYLFHVAIGFASFSFVIGNITDGCEVFRTAKTWIKSTSLPYSIYIYKSISRSLFTFVLHFLTALMVMVIYGWRPTWEMVWIIPAIAIFLINAVSIQLFFGLVATRYNDLTHLVSTVTRILFFTTPIIWTLEERGGLVRKLAMYNPLTHFIEIFRAPIVGTEMLPQSWPIVLGITLIGWIGAIIAGSMMTRRLPFWL